MARVLKIGALVLALLMLTGSLSLYFFLGSSSFDRWAKQKAVAFLEERFALDAEIGKLDIRLFENEVEIHNLMLRNRTFPAEEPAIEIGRTVLDFSILSWFTPSVRLDRLILEEPRLRFVEDPNDRMNVANMFAPRRKAEEKPKSGNGFSFFKLAIRQIELKDGLIVYDKQPILVDSAAESLDTEMRYVESGPSYTGRFALSGFHLKLDQFDLPGSNISSDFEFVDDRLHLSGLEYQSEGVNALLRGSITDLKTFSYDFAVDLESDLMKLQQPDLTNYLEQGTLHTTGRFQGRGSHFTYEGQAQSPLLLVKKIPIVRMNAAFHLDRDWVNFSSLQAQVYGGWASATGRLAWKEENQSQFSVQASGVQIRPILVQFGPPSLRPQGASSLEADLIWPGLHLDRFEGRGSTRYSGQLPRPLDLNLEPLEPVPFEGESTLLFKGKAIHFPEGTVRTPRSRVHYQGKVDFDGRYDFDVEVDSDLGEELLHLARLSGIAPEDWIERYPVRPRGPSRVEVNVNNRSGPFQVTGEIESRQLFFQNQKLGDFTSRVLWAENLLELTGARLKAPHYGLVSDLKLPLNKDMERSWPAFEVELHQLPVERFLGFVELAWPVQGLITGNFRLEPIGETSFQGGGHLKIEHLRGYGEEIDELEADLQIRRNLLSASAIRGRIYGAPLSGQADYDWSSQDYSVDLTVRQLALGEVGLVQQRATLQGNATVEVRGLGNLAKPSGRVRFFSSALALEEYRFEDLEVEADITGMTAEFRLKNRLQDQPLLVKGTLQLEEPFQISAEAELNRLPLKPFLILLGEIPLPSFDGLLTARVSAQGPLQEPGRMEGKATISSIELSAGDYSLSSGTVSQPLTYREGTLQVPAIRFSGQETDLQVKGSVKLLEPQQVNVRVSGTANLRIINGFIEEGSTSGVLKINTEIFGDLRKPRVVGQVNLEEGFFNHPSLPTGIFEARGELKFTANQVSIDSMQARTRFGDINAEGGIFLEGFVPTRWQVNIFGNGLRVQIPEDVTSIVDVDLDFLRRDDSQLLSGVVYIRSAEYTRNISIPQLISAFSDSQTAATRPVEGSETVLDVAVESYRSIRIQNNLADVVASGDFRVRGTLQEPVILGSVVVDDGDLLLENNRYEITRASVNFNNPRKTTPVLNVEAETEVREFTITILVRGPLEQFNINFRSDPPLPTASVVSLLAAGQTQEELFGSETTGQTESGTLAVYGAGSLLSRTLGEKLESQTSRLFGFEKFSIDPFLQGRERDPGARLTLGKRITGDLSFTYITNLGNQTEAQLVVIEYRLTEWLTAVGTRQEDGSVSIDFKLKKRF